MWMIGGVLAGTVLGMATAAGCLAAGLPPWAALAAWSGSGSLAILLSALRLCVPRGAPRLRPQRA
jgi:hypothetical protein